MFYVSDFTDINAVFIQGSICTIMSKSTSFMLCEFLRCQLERSVFSWPVHFNKLKAAVQYTKFRSSSCFPFLGFPFSPALASDLWKEGLWGLTEMKRELAMQHVEEGDWLSSPLMYVNWQHMFATLLWHRCTLISSLRFSLVFRVSISQFEVFIFCLFF